MLRGPRTAVRGQTTELSRWRRSSVAPANAPLAADRRPRTSHRGLSCQRPVPSAPFSTHIYVGNPSTITFACNGIANHYHSRNERSFRTPSPLCGGSIAGRRESASRSGDTFVAFQGALWPREGDSDRAWRRLLPAASHAQQQVDPHQVKK
jgi:hypothetical protein